MALRPVDDVGVMWIGTPIELTKENVVSTNISVTLPEWKADYAYAVGAMVSRAGRSFMSVLTQAASYRGTHCPMLYNVNQDPASNPMPFVPYDEEGDPEPCSYAQAGMAWWAEIDPEISYAEAMFNYNEHSQAEVTGDLTVTIDPKAPYNLVAIFGAYAETATLTVGGQSYERDLFLFSRVHAQSEYPFGDRVTHSNHTFWALDAPTTGNLTLTLTARGGKSALGNLAVCQLNDAGVTHYQSEVSIRDYSRKERDEFGRAIIVPRWYQDYIHFVVLSPSDRRVEVRQLLINFKDKPCVYIGHDNPLRYELQIYGLLKDISLPLPHSAFSIFDLEVEAVGVPKWVSGIPMPPIPDPPPLPDVEIPAPWLAIGHDEAPYITIVNSLTWQKVIVHFEIPGPARAVLFNPDSSLLYIGHECPPYFTVVETAGWTEVPLEGSSEAVASSSDRISTWDIGTVFGLAQTQDGTRLALTHQCPPYLTVLDTSTWGVVNRTMQELTMSLSRSAFSPDGNTLLVTDTCFRRMWIDTREYLWWNPIWGHGRASIFWDDASIILAMNAETYSSEDLPNRLARLQTDDWQTWLNIANLPGEAYIVKFTKDRKFIAVGHRCPPYVTILDATTWEPVTTYFDIEYSVCSLDFTDDGEFLAAVYKHHPYVTIIRTVNWTEFYLSFEDWEFASSNS